MFPNPSRLAMTELLDKGDLVELMIFSGDGAVSQTDCALSPASCT